MEKPHPYRAQALWFSGSTSDKAYFIKIKFYQGKYAALGVDVTVNNSLKFLS